MGVCLRINNKGEAGKCVCERERKRQLSLSLLLSFSQGVLGGGGLFLIFFLHIESEAPGVIAIQRRLGDLL
jgi:hypothetical protein